MQLPVVDFADRRVERLAAPRTSTDTRSASDSALSTFCSTSITGMPRRLVDVADRGEDEVDHERREVAARLVEKQHLRLQQQRQADREHAPLAAAEIAGAVALAVLQLREELQHLRDLRARGPRA